VQRNPVSVSVIVPVYNDPLRLGWCLSALFAQSDQDFELIVVNDGGDDSVNEVCRQWPKVKLLYLDPPTEQFRAGQARNFGVRHSQGDLLLFLDSDCVAPPQWVEVSRAAYGERNLLCGRRWEVGEAVVRTLKPPLDFELLRSGAGTDGYEDWRPVFWSCNLGIPAAVFCAVGGFDERFVGYGHEDVDLRDRLLYGGYNAINMGLDNGVVHLGHPRRPDGNWKELKHKLDPKEIVRNGGPLVRDNASVSDA
jgi:glycosyltransferase involved in cell wall biosynthesis